MSQKKDGPKHGTRTFQIWKRERSVEEINAIISERKAHNEDIARIRVDLLAPGNLTSEERRLRREALAAHKARQT